MQHHSVGSSQATPSVEKQRAASGLQPRIHEIPFHIGKAYTTDVTCSKKVRNIVLTYDVAPPRRPACNGTRQDDGGRKDEKDCALSKYGQVSKVQHLPLQQKEDIEYFAKCIETEQ